MGSCTRPRIFFREGFLSSEMVYLVYFFQSFARSHWFGAVNTAGRIDCEESLFFFRFSEGSARSRECRAERNEVGIPRRKKRVSFLVPLPSRAFSHGRFARRTKNKEILLEIYRGYIYGIIYYLVIYSCCERLCIRIDRHEAHLFRKHSFSK